MKKMWKRFVSLLLACTLLAGMLPLSASAAVSAPGEGSEQYQYAQGILNQLNNELGDGDSKFQLSSAASLGGDSDLFTYVISRFYIDPETNKGTTDMRYVIVPGVGASDTTMPNYSSAKDGQPWAEAAVSTFYIAKGVTGIGSYAFASQPSLNNVVFQDASDLTYIGQRAFYDDDNAVFTDEGNGDGTTLDLSGVTTMGEYAFYNCDKLTGVELGGNITAVETVEGKVKETEHKIPNNAFNNSGLQTVTIPDGIQHIGDGAFGHTSLSKVEDLVLPDGLKTIGDNAFVVTMGSGETGIGITSLTIPSSVNSIGANAFSGRRNLAEVTVEDDNVSNTQLTLGNAAFGFNESSAFSEWGSITDDRTGQKYEGTMGTKFYLPADLTEKFINGTNCYTGDIEPMKWVKTRQPTCDTDGYHLYETTKKGAYDDEGKPLVLQYKYTIPMLGHDWDEGNLVTVAATCETPSYKYEPCTRGCGEINIIDDHVADALSHNYQVNENGGVMNPGIKKSNNTPTTVTYTCQNYKDGDGNLHDGDLDASYTWTIPATTLSATTSDTLADLQLPSVTGSTQASLAWADDVDTTAKLQAGTYQYQVKLVVSNDTYFKPYTDASFTIEVKVEKTKLNFSEVYFENSTRWINGNTPEFSVEGMPEGTSKVKIEYKKKNEENAPWTTEKPKEEAVEDAGEYLVRYTFSYNSTIYDLVTDDPDLLPPAGYTLKKTEDGEGTITGDYRVAQMTMEDVSIRAIDNLTFNGTSGNIEGEAQPTVQLEGVLLGSKVTFTWTEDGEQKTETIDSTQVANFSGAKITNVGTYEVAVKIEKENYVDVDRNVSVTIAKQTLTAPRAELTVRYDTTEKTGVPDSTDNRYTVSGNKQTNAGTYKAEAKVVNSKNYQWPEAADPDGDGTAEISWQILHRLTAKPTIPISQYQYEEETYRQPVTTTSKDIVISYEDDKLVATFRGQTAYTATNAKETNADDYTVTVHLENNNYKWADDQSTTDLTLSWRITPLQIAAPTITAPSATYTGEAYAGQVTLEHSKASDSRGSSQDIIDLDKTKSNIRYYTQQTGGNGGDAPVNAGTYYAGVENWAFADGKVETNYQIIGGSRAPFSISKATATMTFDRKEVSAPYTADGTTLQPVTVTGLVGKDIGKEKDVKGEVQYSYKYSQTPVEDWTEVNPTSIQNPESQKFTEVGYYQITAKWGTGAVSNNYTAKDAIYTLTITQADEQKITLTSADANEGTWELTEKTYTTIYGSEKTFTVTGKAALDDASISYAVKDGSEQGHDGEPADVLTVGSDGKVTIHQAGTATITVKAAGTANVKGTSVEYTVTVSQATPTVSLTSTELEVPYTGQPITEYNIAKPTANVVDGAEQPTGDITYTFYADQECKNKVTNGGGEDNNVPIAVGTYYMKASYPGDTNYTSAESEPVTVTVTKAQLTVDAEGHTGTYDGKTYPAITIKSVKGNGEKITGYTVQYATTEMNTAPDAEAGDGVWQDALSVKDVADSSSDKLYYWYMVTADNYNPAIGKVEVKITPAPLTVTGEPASYEKEYDGNKAVDEALTDITVTAEDVPDVTISVAATGTYDNKNAGKDKTVTLTLTLSGTDGADIDWGNYSYNGAAPTDGKITLTKDDAGTINPKEITVTGISAVDRVYDGTTDVQLTGTPETTDKVGEDALTLILASNATGSIADANVDEGKDVTVKTSVITLGGTDKNNYTVKEVKYDASTGLTVNITPRPVTLQFPNGNSSMTTSYDPNGLTSKPNVYKVSAVAPAEGTGFVSSDALADGDIQYTFKQDDKDVENPINVGEYTVTAELTDEAAKKWSNYTIEAITGTVEIIQATEELTVTVTEKTGLTYTGQGQDPIQSISVKGGNVTLSEDDGDYEVQFKLSEEGDYELDRDQLTAAVKDAKEYTVYWQVTTTNYGNKTDSFTVKVAPATLTLSSSLTKEKEYDGTTAAVVTEQKVTGAQSGENITVSSVSAAYNDANVGTGKTITTTYTVTFDDGVTPGNYTIGNSGAQTTHNDDGTWTVTTKDTGSISAKSITVTIADKNKIYDGKTPSVTSDKDTDWTVDEGALCSQDGKVDELEVDLSVKNDENSAVGTYAITGEWTNKNYDVTFTGNWQGEGENKDHAGTYTIEPRPIDVQIGDAEGFYGDAPVLDNVELVDDTEDGVSDAGLVDGEVLKNVLTGLKLATTANAQSDISNEDTPYTIYAKNGEDPILAPTQLGNYNVTFTNEGTYTVKQRPITITIKDHSSVYGEKIDGGIADPDSGEDYTVAITGNATTGDAIVKGDNLEIKLTTEATADSPVDDYDITGSAEGNKVNNYAITWAGNGGNRDGGGKNGRYTIEEAGLAISFEKGNQVSNGVSINITDSYNANPLVLKNASTYTVVSAVDKESLTITYSIAAAGENGGSTDVATINETTGEVTILKTGTVRITATVTPQGNSNYTGQVTTWYELNIISGGQMALKVTPKTNLAYTGDPQALLESASCSLEGATIKYSLDNQDWQNTIPKGTNAGTYTVYVKATDPNSQYSDVTEHVTVTIDKADLEGTFKHGEKYTHVLVDGNSYDSATANELTISSAGYDAKPAKYTYRSADTTVAMAENGGSTIRIMGSAGQETTITVTVPGDNNYNEGTFTYTLEISDNLSKIVYSVENKEVTYNGQPQTIAVNVTEPASGATVMYWNESTNAYDQTEPPAYTDVQAGGYTIKFQITAPGYKTEEGTATLTINPRDISLCQVEGIAESYTYVGHQIQPETVAVVDDSVILKKDADYTLEYGANQEVGEGEGSVIIKGTGNYTGKVTEYFDIIPVDGSSGITASIAPNFGTYDPDAPVTAEVTVTHQTGSGSHDVDLTAANAKYTISATDLVTGQTITDHGATGTGGTLTFTKPAIYDITLTLTGDHQGEFHLSYTLLPLSNEDGGLTLTVDDETQKVFTYGDEIDSSGAAITVTADGNIVTDQCTLTYEYTGFDQTTVSGDYSPSVLKNAGVYTVTATPKDGSAITGTGTFTFLILQRDLSKAILDVNDTDLVFNHDEKRPSVTVTVDGNAQPTKDTDYTITYYNNVNASNAAKAVVTATGNNFTGSKTADFTIAPKEITADMVQDIPEQYYTGNEVIPPVTITDGNYTLILGYDYTTACEDKGPGAATVTITGTGNYTGEVEKTFTIQSEGAPEPSERFDLAVRPSQWTWGDDLKDLALNVTFGTDKELTLGTEYTLEVNGQTFDGTTGKTKDDALTYIKGLKPDEYTITATGVGAYNGSTDTETVTIQKIQPTVTVTATPNSLSGGGKVTLTLKGEKLPAFAEGEDLSDLLTVKVQNGQQAPNLTELEWTENQDGSLTAELTLPNTNETYTFTLSFVGNDYYESASSTAMVVVGQQTSGGGGGSDPGDQPANPDDTGVSDWLNTKDHLAYLAGYPGGTFGPDQNMTRAEAAQMFYNLLLEKDVEITVEFEDVPADAWYAKPVNTLASLGILSGVGNGRFDPERSITRAEFTVIAMKFANTSGGGVNIFSDVNEDDWFYSAVVDSTQYGWINGYPDGTFRPEATISRAEVTVIVNHMLGRAADRPYVIAHEKELNTFGDVNRGHWGYFHVAEATNAHEYHTEDGTESWTGLS